MPATGHTSVVKGTQTRGSATGTLRRWTPPNTEAIAAGIESRVAELNIPDALNLIFDWTIDAGSADGIERVRILGSQDGTIYEEIWAKDYDPDVAPQTPGSLHFFAGCSGWGFSWVKVMMTSKTGGGGSIVSVGCTESIFTSGQLFFFDPSTPANLEEVNERNAHVYGAAVVYDEAVQNTAQLSSELVLSGVRSCQLELGLKLTSHTSLATLTIQPQVYFNGSWYDLPTSSITAGKQEVTAGMVLEIASISGDFNLNVSVGRGAHIVGERFRFYVTGDVSDGDLEIYVIAKVPY